MFGKKELDSLDEFKKAWDDAPERNEPAKDTGAVTNMDDFDYGDPVKDIAKANEIQAASVVESKATDGEKNEVKTTAAAEPAKLSFKQAFAAAYKSGVKTFDWEGKKFAAKLAAKPAAVQTAKPAVSTVQTAEGDSSEGESTAAAKPVQAAAATKVASAEPVAKQKASTSLLGNFIPPSLFGGDNSTDKKEVASAQSPAKTSSPMRSAPSSAAVSAAARTVTKSAEKKDTGSIFGNFFDSASFGSQSTGDEHRIAANGVKVNHKNKPVDTADAIADKMDVNSKTLLPNNPAVLVASSK